MEINAFQTRATQFAKVWSSQELEFVKFSMTIILTEQVNPSLELFIHVEYYHRKVGKILLSF